MARVTVAKTYKLFIGGAFPRSESGRTYPVTDAKGAFMANAAQGSRKDLREAVVAARKAQRGWAGATAYNRGQVIYRMAEMLEARSSEFVGLLRDSRGVPARAATAEVEASIDRLVHYAGWTDKLASVMGHANAVAGPFFSYSAPEPTGVVGVLAPNDAPLLGLVSCLAPVITGGSAAVVVAAREDACVAVTLAEVAATSDVPAGVINILTGDAAELGLHLAAHRDVDGLDLTGVTGEQRADLERVAAESITRIHAPLGIPDFTRAPGTARLRAFLEIKTVWHPVGAVALGGGSGY